eukprot:s3470_g3.t1
MHAETLQGASQEVRAGRGIARSVGGLVRHQADQVGEVHPSKCLVEVAEVAVRYHLRQRPSPRGLLRQHSKDFCGLFEEASLLGFAAAEVQHQPKQLRTGQSLDDCALPLVELGRLLRVLHVAVGAGVAVLAVPGDEVDARAPAYLWMSKAALTGQQREELCQDRRMLRLLQHLGAHGALWAGAASCGGRLILKLHQVCCLLGEGAHVAAHGVLLAGGFQAETDAPHPPWRRALRARPAGTHLLEVFLHVDKGVAVLELQSHGEETLRGQTSWYNCLKASNVLASQMSRMCITNSTSASETNMASCVHPPLRRAAPLDNPLLGPFQRSLGGCLSPGYEVKLVPLADGRLAVRHDAHPFLQ